MGRWEPNAVERLQYAAVALFLERGYAEVTVAEIAERAGLTKRTFFNHFTDKREVIFAGAAAFEADIVKHLTEVHADAKPLDAAVQALTRGGLDLTRYGEAACARRQVIASSPELQERELIKMAALARVIAKKLEDRLVPGRIALFSAQAAIAVFTAAYDAWIDDITADFATLMRQSLADMHLAIS
ncbi:TetR family transcriptional regulator [Actinospica sp. MGRD01-02]|uniref:TetR family transcriptional regulator n=1 Tax=Actinospica acidithermotolerans TaxID=2828514 RepID=A0A941E8Y5_9ACTN|nr:TetR/AcrR family transcriptional regulator [Actinospica acidithermotolerans]MBR7825715.1 TetR family transcriptional regulator [Actinospica acidithermotolerans]